MRQVDPLRRITHDFLARIQLGRLKLPQLALLTVMNCMDTLDLFTPHPEDYQ
jgi:hypothetical protein